jgi:hypothetical protein
MNKGRSRFAPAVAVDLESLEGRVLLSGIAPSRDTSSVLHKGAAEVAAASVRKGATQTSLVVGTGTLGQPITFTVTVRAPAAAGAPQGTVNITDHGQLLQTLTLSPTTSTNPRFAYSEAEVTLAAEPGGSAYFFGRHTVSATFVPSGAFSKSNANKTFTVGEPAYTTLSNGTKIATIVPGSGAQIQSGQTANVLYTGYLAKTGKVFDDSINDGGAPLSFPIGAGAVIPGFDAGTTGMQVGETRIVLIPPADGYGRTANGPIPANSTLVFVVTLVSIS